MIKGRVSRQALYQNLTLSNYSYDDLFTAIYEKTIKLWEN